MRVGYVAINTSLSCRSSRTFRLASYSDQRMLATVEGNLECLQEILEFNFRHKLQFFRISSDLVPFASHPVCRFPWQDVFREKFREIGAYIKHCNMRVSMHPDQFIVINTPNIQIFENSLSELEYHAQVLELLETDSTAKIQIHIGGIYGEKEKSVARFIENYGRLPAYIKRRLVIENDDRLYGVTDCLQIGSWTGIPVVFDVFHFNCLDGSSSARETFLKIQGTWKKDDGLPIIDYSSQAPGKRAGSHASSINMPDFKKFIKELSGFDYDLMLEIKDKEKSALKAADYLSSQGLI